MLRRRSRFQSRRIFTRRRSRLAPLLAVAAILVGGCAQSLADYSRAQSPRDIEVQWISLAHAVSFAPGAATLDARERERLDDFLARLSLRGSDRFLVDGGHLGGLDPLADARATAITQRLRRWVPGATVVVFAGGEAPPHGVRLVVGRYVALPPTCPDWSRPSQTNPGNVNDGNFGCADAANLSAMIADPADLLRGRDLAPADGTALSLGIRRYRAGQIRNPAVIETGGGGE